MFLLDFVWFAFKRSFDYSFWQLQLRPGERLKLAEKSTEEEDVNLMEKHNQELLGWGNLPIWQGSIDVVTTHLGTENSSARAGRGSKVSKEV